MNAGGATLGPDAIPGDVGAVSSIAGQLRNAANNVHTIQSRISSQGLHGSWSGQAASAFEATLGKLPGELDKLGVSFGAAGGALEGFVGALEAAQAKANWLEAKIEQAGGDLQAAQARHDNAQSDLANAEQAHANATDPVSKSSAQHAVDQARAAAASAQAAVDDHNNEIGSYRKQAESNREQYEDAVRSCCNALDAASALGIQNSALGGIGHFLGDVGHDIAAPFVWVGGHVVGAAEDAGKWLDQNWEKIHGWIEGAGTVLEVLGVVAAVACVFVAPEAILPVLVLTSRAQLATDGLATAGDAAVIATGDSQEKAQADSYLASDGVGMVLDVAGLKALKGAGGQEIEQLAQRIRSAPRIYKNIGREAWHSVIEPENHAWQGWITRNLRTLQRIQARKISLELTNKILRDYVSHHMDMQVLPAIEKTLPTVEHQIMFPSPA